MENNVSDPLWLFEFLVMPMGFTNTPATFQHFMNNIFQDMSNVFVVVYLDNILVYSELETLHCDHVQCVRTRLHENNLHITAVCIIQGMRLFILKKKKMSRELDISVNFARNDLNLFLSYSLKNRLVHHNKISLI